MSATSRSWGWLADAGEMGALIRSTDWSAIGLGALDAWSPSRKTAVGICLRSPFAAALFIGPEERIIYNQHFVRFLPTGGHPATLGGAGQSVRDSISGKSFEFDSIVAADGETIDATLCTHTGPRAASSMDDVRELRAAIDLFKLGRYRQDPVTQIIEWDSHLKEMWGLAPDAPVDLGVFIAGIHPDDRARVQAAVGQSVDPAGDGVCDIEFRVVGVNGSAERWVATRGKTVFEQGRVASFHGVVLDISERKRAEHTNLTLIAELQHRTRNLLAVVDGLAEQTLAGCESLDEFAVPFRERLATLSRVQGLLSRGDSTPVMVGELVKRELRALGAEPDGLRVVVEGPEVALPNRSVQILALGLHELATNARKHGALGSPDGRLRVEWEVSRERPRDRLVLRWEETGISSRGPRTPMSDGRMGLGRTLIEKALPYQLDALTRLEVGDDAVRCVVSIALDESQEFA
jgi:PAS domain S-box-containing protein